MRKGGDYQASGLSRWVVCDIGMVDGKIKRSTLGWILFELPVSKWRKESGNPGRLQGNAIRQVWLLFEATGLGGII